MINISREPKGQQYRRLLEVLSDRCGTFSLTVRDSALLNQTGLQVLAQFEPFRLDDDHKSDWPGTRLLGSKAHIYSHRLDVAAIDLLTSTAAGLYDWIAPDKPEDLCLYAKDGAPVLVTIAHEHDAYIVPEDEAIIDVLDKIGIPHSASLKRNGA